MILTKGSKIKLFGGEFEVLEDMDTEDPNEYITITFSNGSEPRQVQLKAVASEIKLVEQQ